MAFSPAISPPGTVQWLAESHENTNKGEVATRRSSKEICQFPRAAFLSGSESRAKGKAEKSKHNSHRDEQRRLGRVELDLRNAEIAPVTGGIGTRHSPDIQSA
jgi:hypothetical protein